MTQDFTEHALLCESALEMKQSKVTLEEKKSCTIFHPFIISFSLSVHGLRKSYQGHSQAWEGLRSHQMSCHLLSYWVLTNNQDAELQKVLVFKTLSGVREK